MSERSRGDAGMMLPELLVGTVVMVLIMGVISAAMVVTLRQHDNTRGRLAVARTEQAINTWLPADLASAETVGTDPAASPCEATCPPGVELVGSNVLLLSWSGVEVLPGQVEATQVSVRLSYRYALVGDEYQLVRIECRTVGGNETCRTSVAAHDMEAPPPGTEFTPGVTVPSWAVQVSEPYDPADAGASTSVPSSTPLSEKGAKRVVVTINGGGDAPGSGGGQNWITLTAGGAEKTTIAADSTSGTPQFVQAKSRCGGPIALVIDNSNSIGSNMAKVKEGAKKFVDAFNGTPVKLNVVRFGTTSALITGASEWTQYFDMTDPASATQLKAGIDGLLSYYGNDGGTNWEDGLFRVFHKTDGTVQDTIPELVVFFTDGVPTYNRRDPAKRAYIPGTTTMAALPAEPPAPPPEQKWPVADGGRYNQESFERAEYIANRFRSTVNFIGVGVGGVNDTSPWGWSFARGYHLVGYHLKYTTWGPKVYSPPYTYYEKSYTEPYTNVEYTWQEASVPNATILARLTTGSDNGVPAQYDAYGNVTNADVANLYVLPNWDMLANALQTVALAKCGGTVTLQTKVANQANAAAPDPFVYQNTSVTDSQGVTTKRNTTVTTDMMTRVATFDFSIPNGQYLDVEIQPQNLDQLTGYDPTGWSCRAGAEVLAFTSVPIAGSTTWTGIRLRIAPNQAVSCTMAVNKR